VKRWILAALLGTTPNCALAQDDAVWSPAKRTAAATIDRLAPALTDTSSTIWRHAEMALKETASAELLAGLLEADGFNVQRGVSGMPTAFVAEYGSGEPVVAFLAEYDALPTLSQEVSAKQVPRIPGAPGHGCGHNLFGTGSVGAGIALKAAMIAHDLPGTVRVYGTPAEEQGIGKVFMVRDGWFDDVTACLSWHPDDENKVDMQPSKALRSFEVTFYGRSAHAAGAPWKGVSALDAVEAFTTGLNLLREHMPETARIHYVITQGGDAPNVVPSRASIWLFTRGKDWPEQETVYQHVLACVQGADLMAWGEEIGDVAAGYRPPKVDVFTGLYHYNPNESLARVMHGNLSLIGPAAYTAEQHTFARELQQAFGVDVVGMHDTISAFDPHAAPEPGGSTDVANISWICPTIDLSVANWPRDIPAHSWASTAASGSDAAASAMHVAAKVMACAAIDVLTRPAAVAAMQAEFEIASAAFPYLDPLGPEALPSLPTSMRTE
jgi:aminobenzoyl-glutamate utilization protein B